MVGASKVVGQHQVVDSHLASKVLFFKSMALATNDIIVVIVTVPGLEEGRRIGREILTSRLAACVSILPRVESMFWWEGKIVEEHEAMMVVKTTKDQFAKLEGKIAGLHPYEVPEIIAVPLVGGSAQYMEWVKGEVVNK